MCFPTTCLPKKVIVSKFQILDVLAETILMKTILIQVNQDDEDGYPHCGSQTALYSLSGQTVIWLYKFI